MNKKSITSFLTIALITFFAFSACAGTTKGKKKTITKPKTEKKAQMPKLPNESQMKQPFSAKDTLTYFRLEKYIITESQPVKSEVYFVQNSKSKYSDDWFQYLYFRRFGKYYENDGWNYNDVEIQPALDSLFVAIIDMKLYDYEATKYDDADKGRSRWSVEAEFKSGKRIDIVQYLDNGKHDGEFICQQLEAIFENQISRTIAYRQHSSYEKTVYDVDGAWRRRIRYDRDGRVCGGEDRRDPGLTF